MKLYDYDYRINYIFLKIIYVRPMTPQNSISNNQREPEITISSWTLIHQQIRVVGLFYFWFLFFAHRFEVYTNIINEYYIKFNN